MNKLGDPALFISLEFVTLSNWHFLWQVIVFWAWSVDLYGRKPNIFWCGVLLTPSLCVNVLTDQVLTYIVCIPMSRIVKLYSMQCMHCSSSVWITYIVNISYACMAATVYGCCWDSTLGTRNKSNADSFSVNSHPWNNCFKLKSNKNNIARLWRSRLLNLTWTAFGTLGSNACTSFAKSW